MAGRPPHKPTDAFRQQVLKLVAFGNTQEQIAALIGISKNTLANYYAHELATGYDNINAQVANSFLKKCLSGGPDAVNAQKFWLERRAGWASKTSHEFFGKDGGPIKSEVTTTNKLDISSLDDDELDVLEKVLRATQAKQAAKP